MTTSNAKKKPSSTPPAASSSDLGRLSRYLTNSRDLGTSLALVLPLFVIYQLGVLLTDGLRNGVDFVTSLMWLAAGDQIGIYLAINAVILVVFSVAIFMLRKRGKLHPEVMPVVLAESFVYALFFGGAVVKLMSLVGLDAALASGTTAQMSLWQRFIMSIGAGLYEETVFRLVGMGGIFFALRKLVKDMPQWVSALIAVVVSSVIFSAIHHIGSMGDPFTMGVFLFRFFAGILLAVIFYLRGFAVAVYTHAIYDIIVMIFRN